MSGKNVAIFRRIFKITCFVNSILMRALPFLLLVSACDYLAAPPVYQLYFHLNLVVLILVIMLRCGRFFALYLFLTDQINVSAILLSSFLLTCDNKLPIVEG